MPNPTVILTSDEYPTIRAAIDVTLTATSLPDAIIDLDVYRGRAEREMKARITNALTILGGSDEDDANRIVLAACLLCGSYIAPALPAITSQTFGAAMMDRNVDWNQRAADLRSQAETEIMQILINQQGATQSSTMFTFFTRATAS